MTDYQISEATQSPGAQIVPQSREAEESLIGSILINPEAYYEVAQFIKDDDFYIHRYRWIWQVFNRLLELRVSIDFISLNY